MKYIGFGIAALSLCGSAVAFPVLEERAVVGLGNNSGTPELILNGKFDNGTYGWNGIFNGMVQDGQLCVSVPANSSANGSYVRTSYYFHEVKNDVYTLNFTASASVGHNIRVFTPIGVLDPNLDTTAALTTTSYPFSFTFSPANEAPHAFLEFDLGNNTVATTVCLGNVTLRRIDRSSYVQDTGPSVKVNQVGYLPNGPKGATVVSNETSLTWQLRNSNGTVLTQGTAAYIGNDTSSSQNVSVIDFGSYTQEGAGFVLTTSDGGSSVPFSISASLYDALRQDALRFFYQQRSGIAIDGNLVGQQYARAAGHVGIPPNKGDTAVPCQVVSDSLIAYGEPWTCNYTLNVTEGWYDAGDQGKYVVNGGISAGQLLQEYERFLHGLNVTSNQLGDGSLRIPERSNGAPDLLDEARWELEFMLKMQVPAGSPPQLVNGTMIDVSGMVHHKMHDNQWTALPTDPSQDPKRRELHRPGTAATLNLAATAAQAARLFSPYDSAFAQQCLAAARTAYAAAKANPRIYAPGTDWDLGGGAYNDNNVLDEFYWAAAELYLTTGESQFEQDVMNSPNHTSNVFPTGGFSWASVAALGRLDLATVPNNLSDHQRVVQSVVDAADQYLAIQANQSYGLFLTTFPWGSNSNELNIVQVVATAYDLTGNTTYRDAALTGIDYVLGRNALAHSYVTGYGSRYSINEHSRLYAHELDVRVPNPPPGAMSGGANEAANDPPANDVLVGCAPQLCYVDDVNSYSTNEVAINWNSALSWVVTWAADQAGAAS